MGRGRYHEADGDRDGGDGYHGQADGGANASATSSTLTGGSTASENAGKAEEGAMKKGKMQRRKNVPTTAPPVAPVNAAFLSLLLMRILLVSRPILFGCCCVCSLAVRF